MAVIDALQDAITTVRENPSLLLYIGIITSLSTLAGQADTLGLGSGATTIAALGQFLVMPFVLAGIVGLVDEVIDGNNPSLNTAIHHARDSGPSVLGAYLLLFVLAFGAGIALALAIMIPLVNIFVLLAVIPLAFLAGLVLQFIDVSIVLGGASATDSFTASYELVRDNLGATVGYALLRGVVSATFSFPYFVAIVNDTTPTAGMLAAGLLLGVISGTLLQVYHVQFYRRIAPTTNTTG